MVDQGKACRFVRCFIKHGPLEVLVHREHRRGLVAQRQRRGGGHEAQDLVPGEVGSRHAHAGEAGLEAVQGIVLQAEELHDAVGVEVEGGVGVGSAVGCRERPADLHVAVDSRKRRQVKPGRELRPATGLDHLLAEWPLRAVYLHSLIGEAAAHADLRCRGGQQPGLPVESYVLGFGCAHDHGHLARGGDGHAGVLARLSPAGQFLHGLYLIHVHHGEGRGERGEPIVGEAHFRLPVILAGRGGRGDAPQPPRVLVGVGDALEHVHLQAGKHDVLLVLGHLAHGEHAAAEFTYEPYPDTVHIGQQRVTVCIIIKLNIIPALVQCARACGDRKRATAPYPHHGFLQCREIEGWREEGTGSSRETFGTGEGFPRPVRVILQHIGIAIGRCRR